jgi:DNA-binding response OmpR family regulator
MRVLVVEDDAGIREPLREYLERAGVTVDCADDLASASACLRAAAHDAIVLDWMLPDGDGVDWLRALRTAGDATPVILLTARAELTDKVLGLELGADDYVTKPFEPRELLARLRARRRSAGAPPRSDAPTRLESSGIVVDLSTLETTFHGTPVQLTQMELKLLRHFLDNPKRALTREALLAAVWGLRSPTTRTVDVHVAQLRQKLAPELFETLHGLGYRFKPAE